MAFFVHLRGESSKHTLDSKPENGFFGGKCQLFFVDNILRINGLRLTQRHFESSRRCSGLLAGAKSA